MFSISLKEGFLLDDIKKNRLAKGFRSATFGVLKTALIIEICFIIVMPLINVIVKSFMNILDYYDPLVNLIPRQITFFNYATAIKSLDYLKSLAITLGYVIVLTVLQVVVCSLVGYGFARFDIPFKEILFGGVILTIVIPTHLTIIPLYAQMKDFDILGIFGLFTKEGGINLLNTMVPSVLMTVTASGLKSGIFIFLFRQAFKGMPVSLEEAAMIDGAGYFKTFVRIMLPNVTSVMATVILLSIIWQYNDTFYTAQFVPSFSMLSNKLAAVSGSLHSLYSFTDTKQIDLIVNSGVVLTLLPLIIIYLFLQKYFVEGMERSGIVG